MNPYQTAFEVSMEATKRNSEDPNFSLVVREYAKAVYMAMQTQLLLIQYQEQEEAELVIAFFDHH